MPNSQQPTDRELTVRRSELACPANSAEKMAKAAASDADEIVFDLEDGCAPSQKVAARKTLIEAFNTLDFNGKIRAFRPNGMHTSLFYRDVIEVVEAAGARIDSIVLPKIDEASDVLLLIACSIRLSSKSDCLWAESSWKWSLRRPKLCCTPNKSLLPRRAWRH